MVRLDIFITNNMWGWIDGSSFDDSYPDEEQIGKDVIDFIDKFNLSSNKFIAKYSAYEQSLLKELLGYQLKLLRGS